MVKSKIDKYLDKPASQKNLLPLPTHISDVQSVQNFGDATSIRGKIVNKGGITPKIIGKGGRVIHERK